jgi:hypothetical protein
VPPPASLAVESVMRCYSGVTIVSQLHYSITCLQSEDAKAEVSGAKRSAFHGIINPEFLRVYTSLLTFHFVYYCYERRWQWRDASHAIHVGFMCTKLAWVCTCWTAILHLKSYGHSPKLLGFAMRNQAAAEAGLPPIYLHA